MNLLTQTSAIVTMTLFGLIAGFFYAFSVDVMRGLDQIEPVEAIHAMQGINAAVRNPVFFITFFLTPIVALISCAVLWISGNTQAALWIGGAAIVYLLGAFLPTVTINVPMNEALGALEIATGNPEAAAIWRTYSADWTFWNTARTLVSTGSLIMSGIALLVIGKGS